MFPVGTLGRACCLLLGPPFGGSYLPGSSFPTGVRELPGWEHRRQPCPPLQPPSPGLTGCIAACLTSSSGSSLREAMAGHCSRCRVGVVITDIPEHGTLHSCPPLSSCFLLWDLSLHLFCRQGASRRRAVEDSVTLPVSSQLLSPLSCHALTTGTVDSSLTFFGC